MTNNDPKANCTWCCKELSAEATKRGAISCDDSECQRQVRIACSIPPEYSDLPDCYYHGGDEYSDSDY